ncbi:hypothetical protein [Actinoplanes utahensis]|uniref:hypothetical protein n=1 Tax=Actinoplanes utahensis TaxID=1869 RepID=UPI000689BAB6|nr:hypothetical protein [Actinoplanes utahensis]GIF32826.1 hypothetical protein Aut01nite_58120 [Actinoplanes utahensis]
MTDDEQDGYPRSAWPTVGDGPSTPTRPMYPGPARPDDPPAANGAAPPVVPAQPSYASPAEPVSAIPVDVPQRRPAPEPDPVPLPVPGVAQATHVPGLRIGLWGAARGGKSTYLAALPLAAMQSSRRWVVGGADPSAVEYLVQGVDRLVNKREFPPPGQVNELLSWVFSAPPPEGVRRLFGRPPEFTLQLQDVPGEFFRTGNLDPEIVESFATSQGLIYLFDPLGDAADDLRSFNFFYEMLQAVYTRVREAGQLVGGRLPHHVSVCVTKFDEPTFFEAALQARWVNQHPDGSRLPHIADGQGEAFFDWVCRGYRGGTAGTIRDALQTFFHRKRVAYYASSAIGFRLNGNRIFDYSDYHNTEQRNGRLGLRSTPTPVNVLEPLIDLERRINNRRV